MKHDASDDESEEDNVEGDYTVYECPGLAPVRIIINAVCEKTNCSLTIQLQYLHSVPI